MMSPYDRGWNDYDKGIDNNPYPYASYAFWEWEEGWSDTYDYDFTDPWWY